MVLYMTLLGKGLTQEINGDGSSIWWAPVLYLIGEYEITKLPPKKLASNPEKRTQKQAQKDLNEMEWHKMDYLIFSAMRMRDQ